MKYILFIVIIFLSITGYSQDTVRIKLPVGLSTDSVKALIDSLAIPLAGTKVGKPVTGVIDLIMGGGLRSYSGDSIIKGDIFFDEGSVNLSSYELSTPPHKYSVLVVNPNGVFVNSLDQSTPQKGIIGDRDFSPNYDELTYTQKIYVDRKADSLRAYADSVVAAATVGGGMVYPSAGIALSNGTNWVGSITNNSANWNTAFGWGNHASAGYLTSELDPTVPAYVKSITNIEKTNWNSAFDSIGTHNTRIAGKEPLIVKNDAFNKSFGRTLATVVDGKEFIDSINAVRGDLTALKAILAISDTLMFLDNGNDGLYISYNDPYTGKSTLKQYAASAVQSGYLSNSKYVEFTNKENGLGSPGTNGWLLASNTDGTRYWVAPAAGSSAWGGITGTLSAQTDLQNALNLKANLASPTFTGTVAGITKTMVGLGNVDNTTDANKPVSTAQQTALNLKANLASPTFTGTVTLPASQIVNGITLTTAGGTTNFLRADGTYAAPAGGGGGSVSTVSVVSANGFSGSVATATTTPAITLATSVSGMVKGNGTALSAAVEGTDYVAPNAYGLEREWIIAVGDETSVITTGTQKFTFRAPLAGYLIGVRASLKTVSSSGLVTFDINKNGTSVLSTKLSIDASEKTSKTAATAFVISNTTIDDDDEYTIDIDAAGTGAVGPKIVFYYYKIAN